MTGGMICELGADQQLALRQAVGDKTAPGADKEVGQRLQRSSQAEREGARQPSTSQAIAICCIQVPVETTCPKK